METRANYVLIGAFTLAGIILAIGLALWAGRYTTSANWTDFEVRFSQAVTGLATGSSVQYNGIHVGTVRALFLAPEDPRQVIAHIRIQADAPVLEDTVARLTPSGLTGTTFIQLSGGSPGSPRLQAREGEMLPVIPAEESALQRLIATSEGIADTATEVLVRVIELLSEDNVERVANTLANVEAFTGALAADRGRIGETLGHAAAASEHLAAASANLAAASHRVETVMVGADDSLRTLRTALERVNADLITRLPELGDEASAALREITALAARADALIEANAGSFARFGAEGLGQLGPTLQELRLLLQDLSRVTRRIDRDPAQFLLGGSQPEEYRPQ